MKAREAGDWETTVSVYRAANEGRYSRRSWRKKPELKGASCEEIARRPCGARSSGS